MGERYSPHYSVELNRRLTKIRSDDRVGRGGGLDTGKAIASNRAAANDNDPFAGAFERLAGTQKREPYGEPFGDQSRNQRLGKDPSLKG
jgi:hypothetical protein